MSRGNIPTVIRTSLALAKPFGFQASLLNTSDGPIVSLEMAFADAAKAAAFQVD
jgi:hypothetical protein